MRRFDKHPLGKSKLNDVHCCHLNYDTKILLKCDFLEIKLHEKR